MNQTILCEYKGGSHSYGLETPTSDIDLRGVYIVNDLDRIIDPSTYHSSKSQVTESNPEVGNDDKVYVEIRHFLHLLKKGNTQSIEMIFNQNWTKITPQFREIIDNIQSLIDPVMINTSVTGYSLSEYKLAIGARTGKLGGKRQNQVSTYGFSPKNFVNLFRLLYCAETFYETGEFPVNLTGSFIHPQLFEIKTHPERFTIQRLNEMYEHRKEAHEKSWIKNMTTIQQQYRFDNNKAIKLMMSCYKTNIINKGKIGLFDIIKAKFAT